MVVLLLTLLSGSLTDAAADHALQQSGAPNMLQGRMLEESRVRSAFESELQSPAYRRLRQRIKRYELGQPPDVQMPNWWSRFWRWFGNLFSRAPRGGQTGGGFTFGGFSGVTILVWILLGIVLVILVAFIIKSAAVKVSDRTERERLRRELDTDALEPSTPPGEIPSDEYMRRALELAHEGDHRRALRQLVLGGMSWIERAGLIRFRKGLTNRDYVRAVYRREEQRRRFAGIVLDFERVYFGRREATADQFHACLDRYQNAFAHDAPPPGERFTPAAVPDGPELPVEPDLPVADDVEPSSSEEQP